MRNGKGDRRCPCLVPFDEFSQNWDRVFGKRTKQGFTSGAVDSNTRTRDDNEKSRPTQRSGETGEG